MPLTLNRKLQPAGLSPGTPVFLGKERDEPIEITVFNYGPAILEETRITDLQDLLAYREQSTVTWINISGVYDVKLVEQVSKLFGIHPLVQEDITNTRRRPKFEEYEGYLFFLIKMIQYNHTSPGIHGEQVSLIIGENWVLSFQERPGDVFDSVRARIRAGNGRIRKMGPDYLFFALLDAVVDNCFVVMEAMGDQVEAIEDALLEQATPHLMEKLHQHRREGIYLRKAIWPMREALNNLENLESDLICKETRVYLRNLYDHVIQLIDTIETLRDVLTGLFDIYLSAVSNRMNEVMKVLTIIATIFIPITFVAGLYGMNFEGMPELKWKYGYPAALAFMGVMALGMVAYFRKKEWL
jgi:magnesium transporter